MNKKILASLLLFAVSASHADQIPSKVAETIKVFKINQSTLNDGVLRVRYTTPIVRFDNYAFFVKGICQTLWMASLDKKDGWAGSNITRIETVNDMSTQGFAFIDARKSCGTLSQVSGGGDTERKFIASKTWICIAGNPCRQRREGERTAGDD